MTKRRGTLILAAVLGLGIAILSSLPTQDKFALHIQGRFHTSLHIVSFGLLAALVMTGLRSAKIRALLFLAMLFLGWGTEFAEHLRDGWPIEAADVIRDSVGVIIGSLLANVFYRQ